jgi:3',5'-cyclic AMP phosphodiesterase CpdA
VSEAGAARPEDAEPVVLAHISDLHFGAHDALAAESLVADLQAARPHVVVVTGDLTQRARPREFAAAAAFLRQLPSPRLVVLGNHDVPLDRVSTLGPGYRRYLQQVGLDVDPVVDAHGVRVLGLHSMPPWRWKSGHVSRQQAELVTQCLPAAPPGAVRVLALHHPVTAGGMASLAGRSRLLAALAESKAEIVLAGHTHRPATTWFGFEAADSPWCVLEGVAGTATSTRLRGLPRSWMLYRIDRTAIIVEERQQDGSSSGWTLADVRHYRRRSSAGRQEPARPGA